jgi:SAM-dependent methyltransferase
MDKTVRKCPVCNSADIEIFLQRHNVPPTQNFVINRQVKAEKYRDGMLDMAVCNDCGFIYNASFNSDLVGYGGEYENTQAYSDAFNEYMDSLVDHLIHTRNIQQKNILEIGCGNGLFLRKLISHKDSRNTGYGYDVSYRGDLQFENGRLNFFREFFPGKEKIPDPDIVINRHVIEHIDKPVHFLELIRNNLPDNQNLRLFLETPCVEWILDNNVFWDFFYEHCSYFSKSSLVTALEESGFKVETIHHVFNGQYLWVEASLSDKSHTVISPHTIKEKTRAFVEHEAARKKYWTGVLTEHHGHNKIAVWGAGAKGVTFVNILDQGRKFIDCVIDINPNKQGNYIPGTGHSIIAPDEIPARNIKYVIVMNDNYLQEVKDTLDLLGCDTRILSQGT